LRSSFVFPTIRRVVADVNRRRRDGFRIVHFSVQRDHLHLLIEAADRRALSAGARSLAITLALRLNRLVQRRGRVIADRWHARALTSPRAVRHAMVYVIGNFRKHDRDASAVIDVFSSAPFFTGFRELEGVSPVDHPRAGRLRALGPPHRSVVEPARTWRLGVGWQKLGLIGLREGPA